ncbi:protein TolQ [Qipengyuania sp. ASV99]|uniref:protein TolQ n=1 Tax=Qipengyuania sp. ASV99 TaxID=3399681 RepID=UPI003A4C502F
MPIDLMSAAAVQTASTLGPARLDPIELFLAADIVVQAVMVGLILASIWTWTIIVAFTLRIGGLNGKSRAYESDFWDTKDREAALSKKMRGTVPSARVAGAGLDEWKRSTAKTPIDRDAARQRIGAAMESQVAAEADELAGRLNFLATTGSVAPFVGLFGTVWGIMNSFFQIGAQQSASLAVVAPGIAEALFATAIGLFAAIPAVIAYNRFSHAVNQYEARLQRFADKVNAGLSRELDRA